MIFFVSYVSGAACHMRSSLPFFHVLVPLCALFLTPGTLGHRHLRTPSRADRVYVAGREVVHDSRIVALDEARLAERMNEIVAARFRSA